MTAPTAFRFSILLLTVLAAASAPAADPASPAQELEAKVKAAEQQRGAAEQKVAAQKAKAEAAVKRVADLKKQLADAEKQVSAEQAAQKAAGEALTAQMKAVESAKAQLAAQRAADALVAKAQQAKATVAATEKQLQDLNSQLTKTKTQLAETEKTRRAAETAAKSAMESIPQKTAELKAARDTYEAAAKAVDAARLAHTDARTRLAAETENHRPHAARLKKAEAALGQLDASIKSLESSLEALRTAAKAAGTNPEEAGADIAKSLEIIRPLQKRATEIVAAAKAAADQQQAKVVAARNALESAEQSLRTKQDEYAAQSRAHFRLQLALADLQGKETSSKKSAAGAIAQLEQLTTQQAKLQQQIAAAKQGLETQKTAFIAQQQLAERELEKLGQFVSFSRHIAPIFAKKCVACHNSRTAGGRLNMNSFAELAKGGESGASFEAHNAEDSLLAMMIDDGSMPKDADPLSKEDIALVKKWINIGAPLDAGLIATAELFEIMPELPQPLPPETYRVPIPVTATAFNADASILASSGYHEVLLWNTAENKLLRRITNVAERIYDLEFSADGSQLIVAAGTPGQLGEVKLFSAADGKHLKTLLRTKDAVYAVAFSPDGKQVAAGGADRVTYTVDLKTTDVILQLEDHSDWVMDVNWSGDGKQLVSSSRDKTAKVFDVASGKSVATFNGHGQAVFSAAFLADGKSVVSVGSDKQARVWNAADGKEIRKIGGFGSDIFRIVVTADNHLLTACADRIARRHNLADGKLIRDFKGHKDWVYTLSYNPAKKWLATGSYDGEIRVWNSEDGSTASSFIAIPKGEGASTVAAAK